MQIEETTSNNKEFFSGLTFVLLGALGFSAKSILIKLVYQTDGEIDALSLLALRMLFSLPFFLAVAWWHHNWWSHNKKSSKPLPLQTKQWLSVCALGLSGYYVASYLDLLGLHYISAGLERVILFLYPTFVVFLSAVLFKRRITPRELSALVLSYGGMVFVFVEHLKADSPDLWLGSLLILGSAAVFACFTMGSGIMVKQIGSARFTAYTMIVAATATLVHFALLQPNNIIRYPAEVYGLVLLMAIFSTVLPAFFMNAGIKRIGAGPASIISSSGPIATLLLAFLILGETVTGLQLAGTLLVLTGVSLVGKKST